MKKISKNYVRNREIAKICKKMKSKIDHSEMKSINWHPIQIDSFQTNFNHITLEQHNVMMAA